MGFEKSLILSAAGMKAQGDRLRVIAENLANKNSAPDTPGGDPYQRRIVTFKNVLDREMDMNVVKVDRIRKDETDFPLKYDPTHPGANEDGYVKMPNVNPLIEMADMRDANRSYQANLQVLKQARDLISMTIDLMRAR